ncbi:EexN family lipoprotein, partial [uncultured Campylobacter sp.]|uniref:EexN family lipoprotein n=1 Tax=uncultured Campylobacter sp. TaxID=218934 RepID=UPI002607B0A3
MLAALLVGCGDDTEVKTKEYYDAHPDEAKEVLAKCDFNTLKDGSNSYKNCVNAKTVVEEKSMAYTVDYYLEHWDEAQAIMEKYKDKITYVSRSIVIPAHTNSLAAQAAIIAG